MNRTQREQLQSHISELCEDYGPWDVLYVCTETLRPFFKKQAEADAPKRVKKGRDKSIVDTAATQATNKEIA